jgi:hypothetical protein
MIPLLASLAKVAFGVRLYPVGQIHGVHAVYADQQHMLVVGADSRCSGAGLLRADGQKRHVDGRRRRQQILPK